VSTVPDYDVAIVGGGVSGIYTAWRLLTANITSSTQLSAWANARPDGKLRVVVFEGSRRIGGRLLSALPPGMPRTIVEIGGMRYVSSHKLVRSLVENKLELPTKPQVVQVADNLAYLRGRHLQIRDLMQPERLPYQLAEAEAAWLRAGNPATDLIGWGIRQVLPEVQRLRGAELEAYLQSAHIDAIPLYQIGFWNLLARVLSFEACQLARTAVAHDSLGANANAVDMILEYCRFSSNVQYSLLQPGYEAVPWRLEQQVRQAGGQIHLGAWLENFDALQLKDGTTGMSLRFRSGVASCTARALVLAMPRRSIELLRATGAVLDPQRAPRFQGMLQAVEPIALYKMFVCYAQPWWERAGVKQGHSLTDIPVGQCCYWGVEGQQPGADPGNTNAALMNCNDIASVGFWGGLRRRAAMSSDAVEGLHRGPMVARWRVTPPHAGGVFQRRPMPHGPAQVPLETMGADAQRRLRANWEVHTAPAAMVAEMHRQIMLMHGVRAAPEPLDAAFMDWSDDPYGGGVHFWNAGHKSWQLLVEMTQPVSELPCYLCGEAWSTNQTWVEGALQTAEIVLQQRFCLRPPEWVHDE
jgi:monoamine oxidase